MKVTGTIRQNKNTLKLLSRNTTSGLFLSINQLKAFWRALHKALKKLENPHYNSKFRHLSKIILDLHAT